jgi:hypothetical protein
MIKRVSHVGPLNVGAPDALLLHVSGIVTQGDNMPSKPRQRSSKANISFVHLRSGQ